MNKFEAITPARRGILAVCAITCSLLANAANAELINFVFTSDPHYGITRTFGGNTGVSSQAVNQAMIQKMQALQGTQFANDGKIGAGQTINFNFMVVTGDFANRNESGAPVATTSWNQFKADYLDAKPLGNIPVYLTPGNHDVSNAIGLQTKVGTIDNAALAGVYNYENNASVDSTFLKGFANYQAGRDQLDYKISIADGRIDLMFINMWPDKATRNGWMANNLTTNPTLLFTHDQPDVEAKHFATSDPTGQKSYEGLITSLGGLGTAPTNVVGGVATDEMNALSDYLYAHNQIKGYFHGNNNYNQFYQFGGTNVFRADSPMKGNYSGTDESLLSFQVVSIDTDSMQMVSREYLWNQGINGVWGTNSGNLSLAVPEPGSICVLLSGGVMLLISRRRAK